MKATVIECVGSLPSSLMDPILSQMNLVLILKLSFIKINFNTLPTTCLPNGHLPSGYPTKITYARILSPMHMLCAPTICPPPFNLLIISVEEHKF